MTEDIVVNIIVDDKNATAQLNNLKNAIGNINPKVTGLSNNFTGLNPKIASFSSGLSGIVMNLTPLTIGLQLATEGVKALTELVIDSTNKFKAFDDAFREITTLITGEISLTSEGEIIQSLENLQREFGQTSKMITDAFYQSLSAGVSKEYVDDFLNLTGDLALGGKTSMKVATDGLTNIANSFGIAYSNTTELKKASDSLFIGMKYGKTTVDELSRGMGKVTPLASQMGLSFQEVIASISAITTAGVKTTEAVTQMRGVLRTVLKPAKEVSDVFDELGIAYGKTALKNQTLQEWLISTEKTLQSSGRSLDFVFGNVRALSGVMSLAGSTAEKYDMILNEMAKSEENVGKVTEDAVSKMKGLSFYTNQVAEEMNVFQQRLGKVFEPLMKNLLELQSGLIEFATGLIMPTEAAKDKFNELKDVLADVNKEVKELTQEYSDGFEFKVASGEEFEKILTRITEIAPELGKRLKYLSQSAFLDTEQKIKALNTVFKDYVKNNKEFLNKSMTDSVINFNVSISDTIKKYGELQNRIKSQEKVLREAKHFGYTDIYISKITEKLESFKLQLEGVRSDFFENAKNSLMIIPGMSRDFINATISGQSDTIKALYKEMFTQLDHMAAESLNNLELQIDAHTRYLQGKEFTSDYSLFKNEEEYARRMVKVDNDTMKKRTEAIKEMLDYSIDLSKNYDKVRQDMLKVKRKRASEEEKIDEDIRKSNEDYQKAILKANENILKQEEKINDYRIEYYERINRQIDAINEKIRDEKATIEERLKVSTNVRRSQIEELFPQYSTLDNISDQIFDSYEDTRTNINQALDFLQKVLPQHYEQVLNDMEENAADVRRKLIYKYMGESDIIMFGQSEEAMYNKILQREGIVRGTQIIEEIKEEALKETEKFIQQRVKEIGMIDDTKVDKLEEDKQKLIALNVEEDRTYQDLNKQLAEYKDILSKIDIKDFMRDIEDHQRKIALLRTEYQILAMKLYAISGDMNNFSQSLSKLNFSSFTDVQKKVIGDIIGMFSEGNFNPDNKKLEQLSNILEDKTQTGLVDKLSKLGALDWKLFSGGLQLKVDLDFPANLVKEISSLADGLKVISNFEETTISVKGSEKIPDDITAILTGVSNALNKNPLSVSILDAMVSDKFTVVDATGKDYLDDQGNVKLNASIDKVLNYQQSLPSFERVGNAIGKGITDSAKVQFEMKLGVELQDQEFATNKINITELVGTLVVSPSPFSNNDKTTGYLPGNYMGGVIGSPNQRFQSPNAFDDQLSWVQTGEAITRKSVVENLGESFFNTLNNDGYVDLSKLKMSSIKFDKKFLDKFSQENKNVYILNKDSKNNSSESPHIETNNNNYKVDIVLDKKRTPTLNRDLISTLKKVLSLI